MIVVLGFKVTNLLKDSITLVDLTIIFFLYLNPFYPSETLKGGPTQTVGECSGERIRVKRSKT